MALGRDMELLAQGQGLVEKEEVPVSSRTAQRLGNVASLAVAALLLLAGIGYWTGTTGASSKTPDGKRELSTPHSLPSGGIPFNLPSGLASGPSLVKAPGSSLKVGGGASSGNKLLRTDTQSDFRAAYDLDDLPIVTKDGAVGGKIQWKQELETLDYHRCLPVFFNGVREPDVRYRLVAVQGINDLLKAGGDKKVLPVVPQVIIPIKTALITRDPTIIAPMLKIIQALVQSGEKVGEALVPYYRQILPPIMNIYINTDYQYAAMDFSQRKINKLHDLCMQTLEVLEKHGGKDASKHIKSLVPTYQSVL